MISSKPNHTFPVGFLQEKPGLELLMDDLIWPILYDFLLKNTKVVIARVVHDFYIVRLQKSWWSTVDLQILHWSKNWTLVYLLLRYPLFFGSKLLACFLSKCPILDKNVGKQAISVSFRDTVEKMNLLWRPLTHTFGTFKENPRISLDSKL